MSINTTSTITKSKPRISKPRSNTKNKNLKEEIMNEIIKEELINEVVIKEVIKEEEPKKEEFVNEVIKEFVNEVIKEEEPKKDKPKPKPRTTRPKKEKVIKNETTPETMPETKTTKKGKATTAAKTTKGKSKKVNTDINMDINVDYECKCNCNCKAIHHAKNEVANKSVNLLGDKANIKNINRLHIISFINFSWYIQINEFLQEHPSFNKLIPIVALDEYPNGFNKNPHEDDKDAPKNIFETILYGLAFAGADIDYGKYQYLMMLNYFRNCELLSEDMDMPEDAQPEKVPIYKSLINKLLENEIDINELMYNPEHMKIIESVEGKHSYAFIFII
jgi:hypothetical protein